VYQVGFSLFPSGDEVPDDLLCNRTDFTRQCRDRSRREWPRHQPAQVGVVGLVRCDETLRGSSVKFSDIGSRASPRADRAGAERSQRF